MAQLGSAGLSALGTQSKPRHHELIVFNLLDHRIRNRVDEAFFQSDQPVICIICAGVSRLDLCLLEQPTSYQVNVLGTFRLIDDLVDAGVKPVFLSSASTASTFDRTVPTLGGSGRLQASRDAENETEQSARGQGSA